MNTRSIVVAALLVIVAVETRAAAPKSGIWTASQQGSQVQLNLFEGPREQSQHGFSVPISSLSGLDERRIGSSEPVPVSFELRRPAGTLQFLGTFTSSRGSGHYTFTPSETFIGEMRELGYTGFAERTLFLYTTTNLSPAWVRDLRSMGYTLARKDLDDVAIFRVTPEFVREMTSAGFHKLPLRDLVNLRIGNIDADRIREYRALGFTDLSAASVANLGIMQVTPAFIREMAAEGYRGLTASQLTNLRIGQISADDIREYRSLGYDKITAQQLANLGIHRVTPDFIRRLASAGYRDLSLQKLVEMKIHGVTPEYIESLRAAGYANVPVQKLIQLRMSKVDEMLLQKKRD